MRTQSVYSKKKPVSDIVLDVFTVVFLALVAIICVYPFWNIFIISINDATDAIRGGLYFLPRKLSFASYMDILSRSTFLHSILVTLARTAVGTPLAVLVTTALAYVLSRKDLLFKKPITLLFIFTMYFGGGLVPYYMVLKNLGMLDSFIVFIFPNLVSVYNMILVRNYIEGMPEALFEAAKARAKALGYAFLQVKTVQMGRYPEYDATNRFYLALGFRELEVFPKLWDEGNPCQVYILYLGG